MNVLSIFRSNINRVIRIFTGFLYYIIIIIVNNMQNSASCYLFIIIQLTGNHQQLRITIERVKKPY